MSKRVKHSKIKNTGILFELLSRQITQDIISDDKKSKSIDLLKKYFNEKTEIGKTHFKDLPNNINEELIALLHSANKWESIITLDFMIQSQMEL